MSRGLRQRIGLEEDAERARARKGPIGIGSKVWLFDLNRRIYPPKKPCEAYGRGGPIWREYWNPDNPCTIVAETRDSWVTKSGYKIPKKDPSVTRPDKRTGWTRAVAWSLEEIDELAWAHDHCHQIAERVRQCDVKTLREVAKLVGYKEGS